MQIPQNQNIPTSPSTILENSGSWSLATSLIKTVVHFTQETTRIGRYVLYPQVPRVPSSFLLTCIKAVDLHYWGTNNMEWYDPAQLMTKDGSLHITLAEMPNSVKMPYHGGMMSTWNKFCFTGGMILASGMFRTIPVYQITDDPLVQRSCRERITSLGWWSSFYNWHN